MPLVTGRRGTRWTPPRASVSSPVKRGCHLLGFSGNQMEATYKPDGSPPGQSDREQGSDAEAPPMGGGGPRSSQKSKRSLQLSPADDYGVFTLSAGLRGWEYKKKRIKTGCPALTGCLWQGGAGGWRKGVGAWLCRSAQGGHQGGQDPPSHSPPSLPVPSLFSFSFSLSLHLIFLPHPVGHFPPCQTYWGSVNSC